MQPYHIAVLGVGAMGSLFGALLTRVTRNPCLSQQHISVTLFGNWQAHIDAVNSQGLLIRYPDDTTRRLRVNMTSAISSLPPTDVVLVMVKSFQTGAAAGIAKKLLKKGGMVLSLQNGLTNYEILANTIGKRQVFAGVMDAAADLPVAGEIDYVAPGNTCLPLLPGREEQMSQLAAIFNAAGIQTILSRDPLGLRWGKLAVNAAINPLTALLEIRNGDLLNNSRTRELMIAAAREAERVAAASGITLPYPDVSAHVIAVCKKTARNRSSMLQDLQRGRPTEIEAITGALLSIAKEKNIPVPVNEMLLNLMRQKLAGVFPGLEAIEARLGGPVDAGTAA